MASTNKSIAKVGSIALALVVATFAFVLGAYPAHATDTNAIGVESVSATLPMALRTDLSAQASECSNAPGPTVTLSGTIALGGLGVQMTFQNNADGTHTYSDTTDTAIVINDGTGVSIPKQPVDGGVGGNPWIWFMFTDSSGNAVSSPIFLGRCVQGLDATIADPLTMPAVATANVQGGSCSNTGSMITLSGSLSLSGLNGMLMFANSNNPVDGPHSANVAASLSVNLIPSGESIAFQKQPSPGGVGGNPWIYLAFTDGNGNDLTDPVLLGRCVQNF